MNARHIFHTYISDSASQRLSDDCLPLALRKALCTKFDPLSKYSVELERQAVLQPSRLRSTFDETRSMATSYLEKIGLKSFMASPSYK